ncbi:MAG: DUF1549 domain-containing protein, partial [Verrucomicrobiota bacterium]
MKQLTIFTFLLFGIGCLNAEPIVANAATTKAAKQLEKMTPEQRIDQLVEAKLKEQKLEANDDINDATFLRRAYVNIIGRIPTIEEAEAFHTMEYPNKRELLIEKLLDSEGHVSHGYNFWADILRINSRLGTGATQAEYAYQHWLKQGIREN